MFKIIIASLIHLPSIADLEGGALKSADTLQGDPVVSIRWRNSDWVHDTYLR